MFERDGMLYAVSEFVAAARDGEEPFTESVRYRTVGDMTFTGAVRSDGDDVEDGDRRDRRDAHHRARRDARRRPHLGGRDGGPQARGLLLMSTLLRLATAGSVDDGKSTLIGRLLYDSKALLADQRAPTREVDLALLTDGLRAEREQGITIDVAYRYFATPRRTFIIADTPGHVRYTRNMVTGASTADVGGRARRRAQRACSSSRAATRSSSALLGIRHLVACVNKMDLVDWDEDRLPRDRARLRARSPRGSACPTAASIPVSALHGDNVVERSEQRALVRRAAAARAPRARSTSPRDRNLDRRAAARCSGSSAATSNDYRGYAGQVAGGVLRPGDEVVVLPRRRAHARSRAIDTFDGPVDEAFPPMSVTVLLDDDLDVGRGDLICAPADRAAGRRASSTRACAGWPRRRCDAGARYVLKHTTRRVRARVDSLDTRARRRHAARRPEPAGARRSTTSAACTLRTCAAPLMAEPYARNRATGAFILVDEATNDTVGAGMVLGRARGRRAARRPAQPGRRLAEPALPRASAGRSLGLRGATVWLTGLPASGQVDDRRGARAPRWWRAGRPAYLLDGDNLRHGLCGDLGFSAADRHENVRRVAQRRAHARRRRARRRRLARLPRRRRPRVARGGCTRRRGCPSSRCGSTRRSRSASSATRTGLYARARARRRCRASPASTRPTSRPAAPDVRLHGAASRSSAPSSACSRPSVRRRDPVERVLGRAPVARVLLARRQLERRVRDRPRRAPATSRWAMQLSRARRLSSASTSYHGDSGVEVCSNIRSLAFEYSTQRLRDSRSIGESFQRRPGSSMRAWKRRSCSSSLTENQYLTSWMPERTSIRSNSGHRAQELPVLGIGAEAHHPLDAGAVVPGAVEEHDLPGRGQVGDVALEVPLRPLALGRRGQRDDAAEARVERVDDALDRPALAGGVAALEDDDEPVAALADPVEHLHELELELASSRSNSFRDMPAMAPSAVFFAMTARSSQHRGRAAVRPPSQVPRPQRVRARWWPMYLKRYAASPCGLLRAWRPWPRRGGSTPRLRAKYQTACVTAPDISRSDFSAFPLSAFACCCASSRIGRRTRSSCSAGGWPVTVSMLSHASW